jgi:hypothetical protein
LKSCGTLSTFIDVSDLPGASIKSVFSILVEIVSNAELQQLTSMGLFDIFKKKNRQPGFTNLSLEDLLQKAATKPEYRPEFYKRLLSDKLVVITSDNGQPDRGLQRKIQP